MPFFVLLPVVCDNNNNNNNTILHQIFDSDQWRRVVRAWGAQAPPNLSNLFQFRAGRPKKVFVYTTFLRRADRKFVYIYWLHQTFSRSAPCVIIYEFRFRNGSGPVPADRRASSSGKFRYLPVCKNAVPVHP